MKRTAKYNAARSKAQELSLEVSIIDNAALYDGLENAGWFWNAGEGEWENLKRSTSMFENDDHTATGVLRLRVMCAPGDAERALELVQEALDSYGIGIEETSKAYPNRRGVGVSYYITAHLPKEAKHARKR